MKVLAINPGSTSTKIGIFNDEQLLLEHVIRHSSTELAVFDQMMDQYQMRKDAIVATLAEAGVELSELDAIACRGGVSQPISGGTYLVDEQLCNDQAGNPVQHPSSLAALIGHELAKSLGINAYVTDSPVTYELSDLAQLSGHKKVKRSGRFHALNARAAAQRFAKEHQRRYEDLNLIVCHMGGGISISMHHQGRAMDVTDAIAEGPMTPERSGSLPSRDLIDLCFSGDYSHKEVKLMLQGKGGIYSYLGTADMQEVEERMKQGDVEANEVVDAMIYQIAKQIGGMAPVVNGAIDGVILTGGIAYWNYAVSGLKERVGYLADVVVYPGEMELEALVAGVLSVLRDGQAPKVYHEHIIA